MNLKTKFAIVTGASQGLGKSFAIELAEYGCNLILIAKPKEQLNIFSAELKLQYGIEVIYYEADLTITHELDMVIDDIKANHSIDILINNVGIGAACCFGQESSDFINRMIGLNITVLSVLTHAMLPLLRQHDEAFILNVSSMIAFSPTGYKSVYPASKAYVHSFSMGLAEELKDSGIQVSVVFPGGMKTNKFVCERLKKHGVLAKSGVIPTNIVAKVSLRKMFEKRKFILVGWSNYAMWILMKLTPSPLKLALITKAMKNEVMQTTTKTEIS